ncbi:MAG TPA: sensor histidine kinase [Xanthobacteraceae bacterium]|nr:sensor histidine kinase [Xanthobacteraceae bacterium]
MALKGDALDAARQSRPAAAHSKAARSVAPKPIALFLMLLVLITILPALGFSVVLLQRNNEAQQQVVSTLASATAASLSEAVDREVSGMLTSLRVLSSTSSLTTGDLPDFYTRAQRALAGTGGFLVVLDRNYNQLLNTRVPYGTALGKTADPDSAAVALEKRQPVISNVFFGKLANKWVFDVVQPIFPDRGPPLILMLTQNADSLTQALVRQKLADGWNVTLVDSKNMMITSSASKSGAGKPFFLDLISHGPSPSGRVSIDYNGVPYQAIVQASELTGWKIVVWARTAAIEQPMRHALEWLAFGGLVVVALGVGAALLVAHQIARPVRRLARDARRLGAGEPVRAVNHPIAELATVSRELAEAAERRKEAENEIRFLMREVAHRSKNQLTVVSSIAKQTARTARTVDAFQDSFQKRLFGLARSTDLLIAGGVAGVEFRELLAVQIDPFKPSDPGRLELSGPEFRLGNQAAQMLGLGLHELATNAAKYGAFASPGGRLVLNWRISDGVLDFVWREHVPRFRRRAERRGFGTEVIERMLRGALDAEAECIFHSDGIEWHFRIPLERIRPSAAVPDDGSVE